MDNQYEFAEEDQNSGQAAIENSMAPEIVLRSQLDEITEPMLMNLCRQSSL